MPLLSPLHTGNASISFWHLTEDVEELLALLPHSDNYAAEAAKFGAERRRREWLGARCLLHARMGDAVQIVYAADGRPLLHGVAGLPEISISHSGDYVAIAFAPPRLSIGLDIEAAWGKAFRLRERFLTLDEQRLTPDERRAAAAWCAKEAAYKLYHRGGIQFIGGMILQEQHGNWEILLPKLSRHVVVKINYIDSLAIALAQWA